MQMARVEMHILHQINRSQVDSQLPPKKEQSTDNVLPLAPLSFVDQKMFKAYGVTLTNSEGSPRTTIIDLIWEDHQY